MTVIGVGVGLAGLILNGQRATSRDISELRSYVHEELLGLRERMARLEGLFEGHVKGDCSE